MISDALIRFIRTSAQGTFNGVGSYTELFTGSESTPLFSVLPEVNRPYTAQRLRA